MVSWCSMVPGKAVPYALFQLQERAELFVSPGDEVYEGMIVAENARDNDLVVNPTKEKKLTNVRASGSDEKHHLEATSSALFGSCFRVH